MALLSLRKNDFAPWSQWEAPLARLFDDFLGEVEVPRARFAPAVDLKETDEAYVLTADVPGMSKEDIHLSVHDNVVTLKGERKEARDEKDEKTGYHRYERRYGSFQRSFQIPDGIDGSKVEAEYKDGVLNVTLPKREEVKPKQIEVKVG